MLGRWHMVARPARFEVISEVRAMRSRIHSVILDPTRQQLDNARLEQMNYLLDLASYPFRYPNFYDPSASAPHTQAAPRQASPSGDDLTAEILPINSHSATPVCRLAYPRWRTRVFDALFWTRGAEFAAWSLIHEVGHEFVKVLHLPMVRARLEVADQELRALNSPVAVALADRIHESLTTQDPEILEQERELLQQFQAQLKPFSVPEAACSSWFAILSKNAADLLAKLEDWQSQNQSPDSDPAKCQDQLKSFLEAVRQCKVLADEADSLASLMHDFGSSNTVLPEIRDVFDQLAATVKQVEGSSRDSAQSKDGFIILRNSLNKLEPNLGPLTGKLQPPLPDSYKADLDLLDLCKARAALLVAVRRLTAKNPGGGLLQEILSALQQQNDAANRISQCQSATEVGSHFADVKVLASGKSLPAALFDRISAELTKRASEPLKRWRALLIQALVLIDGDADSAFSNVTGWHNKLMWLVVCALIFVVGVGMAFGNSILLLAGAVGGLLSRLQRTLQKADVPNDYGVSWGALFLSPLTGALTAWGGTLLIILGVKFNILGAALHVEWDNSWDPAALAVAVILGFSERWFSGILNAIEPKVTPPAPAAHASTALPAPTITSTDPTTAKAGQTNTLRVMGTNFQAGATASFTDSDNKPIPAAVDPGHSATTMNITFRLTGTTAHRATLTVTNPDRQFATYSVEVTA